MAKSVKTMEESVKTRKNDEPMEKTMNTMENDENMETDENMEKSTNKSIKTKEHILADPDYVFLILIFVFDPSGPFFES